MYSNIPGRGIRSFLPTLIVSRPGTPKISQVECVNYIVITSATRRTSMADSAKLPGGGQKGRPGRPGVAPTPPQPPTPPRMKPIPPASQPSPSVKKAPNPIKVKKQSQ